MDFAESGRLKIGDYVCFKNAKLDSFLCAEGILDENVIVEASLSAFESGIFQVHLQRQYSALTEFNSFVKENPNADKSEDVGTLKYYKALLVNNFNYFSCHLLSNLGLSLVFFVDCTCIVRPLSLMHSRTHSFVFRL